MCGGCVDITQPPRVLSPPLAPEDNSQSIIFKPQRNQFVLREFWISFCQIASDPHDLWGKFQFATTTKLTPIFLQFYWRLGLFGTLYNVIYIVEYVEYYSMNNHSLGKWLKVHDMWFDFGNALDFHISIWQCDHYGHFDHLDLAILVIFSIRRAIQCARLWELRLAKCPLGSGSNVDIVSKVRFHPFPVWLWTQSIGEIQALVKVHDVPDGLPGTFSNHFVIRKVWIWTCQHILS